MSKNFLEIQKRPAPSHYATGKVDLSQTSNPPDLKNKDDFFERVVIPPKTSMSYHKHGQDEEMYIILEGTGTVTIEGKEHVVKKGDLIKNPPYSSYDLVNDSDVDLELMILNLRIENSSL